MEQMLPPNRAHRQSLGKKILMYGCLPMMILFVVIVILGAIFGTASDKRKRKDIAKTESKDTAETENEVDEHEQTPAAFQEQLEREIASFSKPLRGTEEEKTVEQLQLRLILLQVWEDMLNKADSSADAETKKLGKALRDNVVLRQKKEFPLLRKRYSEIIAGKLWEHDVEVDVSGKRYKCISFTAGVFVSNKNIKEFQDQLSSVLRQFRFTEVRYRWYKGQDEYQYFNLDSHEDNEITKDW